MKKLTLALLIAAAPTVAVAQPQEIHWDHNGSLMRTVDDGVKVAVFYERVRPSLRATTPPGAIAFEGTRTNGNGGVVGNAFVYTKYCYGKPFPYRVTGVVNGVVDVWGPAAVVDPNTCRIVGFSPGSDNAHRTFQIPPPPVESLAPAPLPAAQQNRVDDDMLKSTAMLIMYSKQCNGEVKPEYRRAGEYAIAQKPARFKQIMAVVEAGFPAMGREKFCARMEDEYAKFIQLPDSSSDPFKSSSEMDVVVAFGMALTIGYERCGGYITAEQKLALKTQLAERGPMIAKFSDEVRSSSCSEISSAYIQFLKKIVEMNR